MSEHAGLWWEFRDYNGNSARRALDSSVKSDLLGFEHTYTITPSFQRAAYVASDVRLSGGGVKHLKYTSGGCTNLSDKVTHGCRHYQHHARTNTTITLHHLGDTFIRSTRSSDRRQRTLTAGPHLSVSIWYCSRNLLRRCQAARWTVFTRKRKTH